MSNPGFMSNMEQAIKDLQDALVVIAEIEKRQSAMLRDMPSTWANY